MEESLKRLMEAAARKGWFDLPAPPAEAVEKLHKRLFYKEITEEDYQENASRRGMGYRYNRIRLIHRDSEIPVRRIFAVGNEEVNEAVRVIENRNQIMGFQPHLENIRMPSAGAYTGYYLALPNVTPTWAERRAVCHLQDGTPVVEAAPDLVAFVS